MTLPPTVSNLLWLRESLKQKFLLSICQQLMHFLSMNFSSFPHECLASTVPCGQEPHSPLHLSLHGLFLGLSDAPSCSPGRRAVSPCSSSSPISGLHIWPCSWLNCSNLAVIHKEAIPYFWSSSLLLMNLYPVVFLLTGGEGTAQSQRCGTQ